MVKLPSPRSGNDPLEIAARGIMEAGEALVKYFYQEKSIKFKGRGNIVTNADIEIQAMIVKLLKEEFPGCGIIGEESLDMPSESGFTWIVDPLDGSNNFYFGIPFFAINLALQYENDVVLGLTYDPIRKEMFRAVKGQGASLNDVPLRISSKDDLKLSLICCDLGYNQQLGKQTLSIVNNLCGNVHSIRLLGSGALGLAYASCNRVDLYFHSNLYTWDIAPGLLLLSEAGGCIYDWNGQKAGLQSTQVIAANQLLYRKFTDFVLSYSNRTG